MHLSKRGEIQDRFWSRVDKSGGSESCWIWTGSVTSAGYGAISGKLNGKEIEGKTQNLLVHRVSWIMANGPIPVGAGSHGTVVMHKCDNRLCVNPAHLMLGTQRQNLRDMGNKGRFKLPDNKGIKNPNAALSAEQETEVLASRDPSRQVARRYGVDKSVILRIRRNAMTPEERAELRRENYRKQQH